MQDITVAAVSMHARPGEIDANLSRTESFVIRASEMGIDIICFPELSLTGYSLDRPGRLAAKMPREEILERVIRMAREREVVLIAGFVEALDDEKPYISQIIAGPGGLIGIYRKTHLSPLERTLFRSGEKIEVYCHGDIRFGVQMCYEAHFPEISTVMALQGADVIFLPHASPRGTPEEKTRSWLRHMTSRAFDNALFIVACNQVGKTEAGFSFPGVALVIGPDGNVMSHYAGRRENMLVAVLGAAKLKGMREHRMKYFLPNRRPDLYTEILCKTK